MYRNLEECIIDLEKNGHLIRITEEVDPHLEMASIHLKAYEAQGPTLLFENVKGSKYRAVSNLFGTVERSKFIFRDTLQSVQDIIALRNDPMKALKNPFKHVKTGFTATTALPAKKRGLPVGMEEMMLFHMQLIRFAVNLLI